MSKTQLVKQHQQTVTERSTSQLRMFEETSFSFWKKDLEESAARMTATESKRNMSEHRTS